MALRVRKQTLRAGLIAGSLGCAATLTAFWLVHAQRVVLGAQDDGRFLVSTGQVLTPFGKLVRIEGARPKDLAISPDGQSIAALCNGLVAIFDPNGNLKDSVPTRTGALGIAWGPEGRLFATTDRGTVIQIAEQDGKWQVERSFEIAFREADAPRFRQGNPQVNGLAVSADGRSLFVAMGRWNHAAQLSLPVQDSTPKVNAVDGFPTDVAPYRVAVSGRFAVAANRGGRPPSGDEPSSETSGTRVAVDERTDAAKRGSLTIFELESRAPSSLDVGRQPSGLAFQPGTGLLAVCNSDDDTVMLVDLEKKSVVETIKLWPEEERLYGHIPTDLAWSEDGRHLFVACGGINAVAVLTSETGRLKLIGHLPTAWFPIAIRLRAGMLYVACSKGIGSRPLGKATRFGVHDNVGSLQVIQVDAALTALKSLSEKVAANNRWGKELPARPRIAPRPIPERVGEPSRFKHVVYVIKENLTYDAVLGDLEIGNGDPTLCMFPETVSPNHHALAREFVLLDNFYTSGTNSADGHQWTSSSIANGYIEQNYAAHIRSYPYDGGDPLAFSPEGFLWNAAVAKSVSVRVFGEFVDKPVVRDRETGKTPTWSQLWEDYKAGGDKYEIRAETSQAALRSVLHPRFIGFPSIVSDQWRADQFLESLKRWEALGNMPSLCVLLFPNDHTSGTTPGMPTPRAAVADNDLALGRVVEALSNSRFWRETLILVVEDDSQLGVDHVDGHRTAAFCISPYTRRNAVVSEPFNHTSIVRTIGLVLGMPAMNRFDRAATPLSSCFTLEPDFRPYTCRPSQVPLDEINPSPGRLRGEALKLALASARLNWKDVDLADATTVARSVWSVTNPGRPFPWKFFKPNKDDD